MWTIKFSTELNLFQIDDKDITINNVCEKCVQIFKMDDASVRHQPIYVSLFDDSLVCHLPGESVKNVVDIDTERLTILLTSLI